MDSVRDVSTRAVSVVMPCFNAAATIVRAVESIGTQSRPPLEVIAVDDASHDATGEMLDGLERRRWPFAFHVVRLAVNRGPGDARNAGLERVSPMAEFVAFHDADDVWLPWKLERQVGWMERHAGCGWTAHRCGVLGEGEVPPPRRSEPTAGRITRRGLLFRNGVATPAVVARRGLPCRFRPGWRHCEDLMLWLDWLDGGHEGYMLHETMACLGRRPRTPGGSTGDLEAMHGGERRVLHTLAAERRMDSCGAWLWEAYARMRYLLRVARA